MGGGKVESNGIEIWYEDFGDRSNPTVLLIMGMGGPAIYWPLEFIEPIVDTGYHVVRFDNRDTGLSTWIDDYAANPYSLDDMAADAVGLMDALKIELAHVIGMSMGGMIAQTVAIRHPGRTLSLTSIMSSTGNPKLPPPDPQAMKYLIKPVPSEREPYIEHAVTMWKVIGGKGFEFDEERVRNLAARSFDRSFYPPGFVRQLTAIIAHGNRKPALASVTAPTLVIHGGDDPLVPLAAGKDTAEAIPGAELLVIDGMGHDLPREAWPRIVDGIVANALKAKN